MLTTLTVVTLPAVEPVSLDQARTHCRIDTGSDDELLASYLTAARAMAEQLLGRVLITQTLLWTVMPENPVWPSMHFLRDPLELPRSPVQSISSVTVRDTYGNVTTIAAGSLPVVPPAELLGYKADLSVQPAQLVIGPGTILTDGRNLRQANLDHVQVQFVAGYGTDGSTVPQPIRTAILLITAFLYENRGDAGGEMPRAARWLLDPYRLWQI